MKKAILLITVLVLVSSAYLSFAGTNNQESALQAVIRTERAFAAMSEEEGIRPSFLAYIADDGILFRPKAVKGKQWMTSNPLPRSDKQPLLRWQPSYADVASAGDMGYTFGPWEFKTDVKEAQAVDWGHFVTVWKKQADGSWKFAVDLGISHPSTSWTAAKVETGAADKREPEKADINIESEKSALVALEREFSKSSETSGAQAAFLKHAADNVRVFREKKFPFAGKAKVSEAIPANVGTWTWEPEAWDVSRSGDLGYSYGTYWLANKEKTAKETGNYFRIWKKQGGVWKVVVDLANPVPEK
ncbi:MAG TPA: DUF4440 domain-containing protein [Pyrinomonadaceae bacterium]|nr:DUF4440 domain-containing protein [Pyrinomonadaceae bacterium]